MKQIDLEPEAYRETGRDRIIRSILHKPVFLTISTVLGVWVALAIGTAQASGGFARAPEWAFWALYPSFAILPAFLLFCVIVDGDRKVTAATPEREQSSAKLDRSHPKGAVQERRQPHHH